MGGGGVAEATRVRPGVLQKCRAGTSRAQSLHSPRADITMEHGCHHRLIIGYRTPRAARTRAVPAPVWSVERGYRIVLLPA